MEFKVSCSAHTIEDKLVILSGRFASFSEVLNFLDMIDEYYFFESVSIIRVPISMEVPDEL